MVKTESEKSQKKNGNSSKGGDEGASQSSNHSSKDNIDKIGVIFDRGIDLVETGLELGVNLVSKLGGVASDKASDILKTQTQEDSSGPKVNYEDLIRKFTGQSQEQTAPPEAPPNHRQEPENSQPLVSNRMPAFAGGEVTISFSIDNETHQGSKQLQFAAAADFVGDKTNFQINAKSFKINPSKISIAPMDFEKLVFSGKIPENAPPDAYRGLVTVSGEDEYQIPLVIIVSSPV
ncbi:MAG: hypothetical protein OEV42_03870 [Deltaproteobacteria bacterium]|nr:hypothetical protein [Deltaproteobacteria bacterium]